MKPEIKMNRVTETELSLVVLPKSKVPDIEGVVHDELEDLAIIYCFMKAETGEPKHHIIMIPNDTLNAIGYPEDQIKNQAVANAINKQPIQVSSINSFFSSMYKLDPIPMYVATVPDFRFGAKVLAYPGFLNTQQQLLAVATISFRHLSMSLLFSLMTAHRL